MKCRKSPFLRGAFPQSNQPRQKLIRQNETADQEEPLSMSTQRLVKICELRAKSTMNHVWAINRAGWHPYTLCGCYWNNGDFLRHWRWAL